MTLQSYVIGVGSLLCAIAGLGVVAVTARSLLLPRWQGAPALLADVVIGLALAQTVAEGLGTVGLFHRKEVVGLCLLLGAGAFGWRHTHRGRGERREGDEGAIARGEAGARSARTPAASAMLVVALLAGAVVLAEWAGPTLHSLEHGITGADSVWYHLPHAASFAQTGQITGIRYTDIDYLTGLYPATGELFHALGIVLLGSDVLSPGLNLIFLALVLLAAWCLGSPRGLGASTMLAGALVMGSPMMVNTNAGSADVDAAGTFFVVAAVALWMNGAWLRRDGEMTAPALAESTGSRAHADIPLSRSARLAGSLRAHAPLFVAALAAGLALSVKMNLAAPVGALAVAAVALAPAGTRRRVMGWLAAGLLLTGGYWYVRNVVVLGNPVPWFSFGFLPTPHPAPLQQHTNYSIVSYLTYPHIISGWLWPALAWGLGPWWVPVVLLALLGPILCLVRGDRVVRALAAVALGSLAIYPLTPLTACGLWGHPVGFYFNQRYATPALILALAAAPLAAPFAGRRARWIPFTGFLAMLVAMLAQQRLWNDSYSLTGPGAALGLVAVVALLILLRPVGIVMPRPALPRPALLRLTALTGVLTLLLAGIAAGYGGQRDYLRHRYKNRPGLYGIYRMWRWARTVHHERIAVAGTFGWYFGYPLYGLDDSNHVEYIGRRGAGGSFQPVADCRSWRQAINAGRFHYVVTTSTRTMWTRALSGAPEGGWTSGDPAARLLPADSTNQHVQVFRITGRLHPESC